MTLDSREALIALRKRAWESQPSPWMPIRAARTATLYTWRYGRSVPSVPLAEQWRQQYRLRSQFRSSFDSYYRYRLYDPSRLPDAAAFLELEELIVLRRWLYGTLPVETEDLADKRRFHDRAVAAGLPTPPVVASVAGGKILKAPLRLPNHDLFTKEAHALCGQGATYWIWHNDGTYVSTSGERVPQGIFLERLANESRTAPYLVQGRLTNHPAVAPFSRAGLCTVRAMTGQAPGGEPVVWRACFRMPTGSAAADNFAAGGVASPIDLDTGRLGMAVQKSLSRAGQSLTTHPTTGAPIEGTVVPLWPDVLSLAVRAHRAFTGFPSVGWDIAITPDGPMLIEGNFNWDSALAQQPHGRSLAATPFAEHFWAYVSAPRDPNAAVNRGVTIAARPHLTQRAATRP